MNDNAPKKKGLNLGKYGSMLLITGLFLFYANVAFTADGSNVFAPAVAAKLGVDSGIILSMNSIAGLIAVAITIFAGQLNRKIGPRKICGFGFALGGIAYILAANAPSVALYTVAMCLTFGGLNTAMFVGFGALNANWFPKKMGAIMGIAAMGAGLGTMTFVAIFSKLVASMGVNHAAFIPGIVFFAVAVFSLIVHRDTPKERGLFPDNVSEEVFLKEYAAMGEIDMTGGWTIPKVFKTKETWLCGIACGLLMLCQVGIMSQLVVRNIEVGFSQTTAILIMSIIAIFGMIFSPIVGGLVTKWGAKKTVMLVCIIMAVAMILNLTGIKPLYWVSLILIGMTSTAPPNFVNSLPGSVFGRVGFPVVNSVVFPIISTLQMLNFAVNGIITLIFGSLRVSYITFTIFLIIALILVAVLEDRKYNQDFMAAKPE